MSNVKCNFGNNTCSNQLWLFKFACLWSIYLRETSLGHISLLVEHSTDIEIEILMLMNLFVKLTFWVPWLFGYSSKSFIANFYKIPFRFYCHTFKFITIICFVFTLVDNQCAGLDWRNCTMPPLVSCILKLDNFFFTKNVFFASLLFFLFSFSIHSKHSNTNDLSY